MGYKINFCEKYQYDNMVLPRKVQKKVVRTVQPALQENPSRGPAIKKLKGYKNHWRYKINADYRLIYTIEDKDVIFIKAGIRKNVYDSIHYDPDKGPTIRAIAEVPEILEKKPTPQEYNDAVMQLANAKKDKENELPLEKPEIEKILQNAIPEEYYQEVKRYATSGDLIHSNIPDEAKRQVLNAINPPTIAEIINSPVRVLQNDSDLLSLMEGKITVDSLLLRLDNDQKAFVNKFRDKTTSGPWLLKGGPGSGKSTIAIYCIKEIIDPTQLSLEIEESKKILFTTFTNSLVNSGSYLMNQLLGKDSPGVIFHTLSYTAALILKDAGMGLSIADEGLKRGIYYTLIKNKIIDPSETGFNETDWDMIDDEIEWVIYANNIKTLDEYLKFERVGRGKILGKEQRKNLWHIYKLYDQELVKRSKTTSKKIFIEALECLKDQSGIYDYVFLDEAQDLPPIAIKFAIKLCKNPQQLFVTADINQSIYGKNISWKSIDQELKFQGRTTHLKKNYRLPREIMMSLKDLMKDLPHTDPETLADKCVYSGQQPSLAFSNGIDDELRIIADFINESMLELRLTHEAVAILCPNNKVARELSEKLPEDFDAKYLTTKSQILRHNGVKVLTIHAAKGLQFPVVIVPQLTKGIFPPKPRLGIDPEEFEQKQRRVLFVACTRTVKKLLVTTILGQESDYVKYLPEPHWKYIKNIQ